MKVMFVFCPSVTSNSRNPMSTAMI
jgi:hypothetical protein